MVTNKDWIKLANLIGAKEYAKAVIKVNSLLPLTQDKTTLLIVKLHCCSLLYRNIAISRCLDELKKISPNNDIIKDYEVNPKHPLLTAFIQSFVEFNLNPVNDKEKLDELLHLLTYKRITK